MPSQGNSGVGAPIARAAATAALEMLEAGDQAGAVEILMSALEDAPAQLPSLPCPECGLECHWPGRLEAHLLNVHPESCS